MITLRIFLQRVNSNVNRDNKHIEKCDKYSNILKKEIEKENNIDININIKDESYLLSEIIISNEYDKYKIDNSCIIKIVDPLYDYNNKNLIYGDSIEKLNIEDLNSSFINKNSSSIIKSTQLDSIIEDYNEDYYDDNQQITTQTIKLCCDREIVDDSNNLHSRLLDLSKMNHVIIQFNENGHLLNEFIRQIDKLKINTDYIFRTSNHIPRDAELLEARYSTLLSTIETLSLLLKISQIPACRYL
ncbi:unnamed protein product, partial [Rotaria sp. Silwood2]